MSDAMGRRCPLEVAALEAVQRSGTQGVGRLAYMRHPFNQHRNRHHLHEATTGNRHH